MPMVIAAIGAVAGAISAVGAAIGIAASVVAVATTVATIASVALTAISIVQALTAKPPPARGGITQVVSDPDAPQPYVMGEGLYAGILRHDTAYGGEIDGVHNPYRWMAIVYSGGGPVQSILPRVDQAPISSWYSTHLSTNQRLGLCPDTALTPAWSGTPGWSTAHKLSGQAAIGWNLKFDRDGKKFASGLPRLAAYGQWVKVYDPRADSTFPGGIGECRLGDESTYVWSENPALHAGTYAYGRYQNGKFVIGVGLPEEGIDWNVIAAWANVCQINAWKIFGVVYEPGDRWANLKDIAMAGGAVPVFSGGLLSFKYSAPSVALDTITEEDLAGDDIAVTPMSSWRDRINTIVPKYTSADHDWEQVAADPISVPDYVTEDGQEKKIEWPFNCVKHKDQAAQLAMYKLVDSREIQPIELVCNPRLRGYKPGECLDLFIPSLGLDTPAIILQREIDPASMKVKLTLIGETVSKHAFALGKTSVAPDTPALVPTGEDRDLTIGSLIPNGITLGPVNGQGFTFLDGVASPASQTLNFVATLENSDGPVSWTTSPTVTLTTSGTFNENASLTLANFGSNNQVVITAYDTESGKSSSFTVLRLNPWATVGAPIGTPVGTITAGDVSGTINSGGGVGNNQVPTSAIVANAVTTQLGALTAADIACPISTATTVQTLVVTGTGQPIWVDWSVKVKSTSGGGGSTLFNIQIKRNGTIVYSKDDQAAGTSFYNEYIGFFYDIGAGTGVHTYTMVIDNIAAPATAKNREIYLKEFKR